MSKKVKLVPIAMRRPTEDFIYAPSKIRPVVEISQNEFDQVHADSGKAIQVSLEADGVSNPQPITSYTKINFYGKKPMVGRFIVK